MAAQAIGWSTVRKEFTETTMQLPSSNVTARVYQPRIKNSSIGQVESKLGINQSRCHWHNLNDVSPILGHRVVFWRRA